jgi:hypothetical protein
MLIKAGLDMEVYDEDFASRLSNLNDLRNGIHLKKQALLRKTHGKDHPYRHIYTQKVLEECKSCLEELRQKIAIYRSNSDRAAENRR